MIKVTHHHFPNDTLCMSTTPRVRRSDYVNRQARSDLEMGHESSVMFAQRYLCPPEKERSERVRKMQRKNAAAVTYYIMTWANHAELFSRRQRNNNYCRTRREDKGTRNSMNFNI